MNTRSRRPHFAALALALVAAGCSSDHKVGKDVDLNVDSGDGGRLGTTTTTAPAATSSTTVKAPPSTTTTVAPTSTTTTTRPAPQAALTIEINGDGSATQFDPVIARVYVNSTVEWKNVDAVARSVVADSGTFRSAPIAPGASFFYKATVVGKFNYHDGTRPYAVASLEVVAR